MDLRLCCICWLCLIVCHECSSQSMSSKLKVSKCPRVQCFSTSRDKLLTILTVGDQDIGVVVMHS